MISIRFIIHKYMQIMSKNMSDSLRGFNSPKHDADEHTKVEKSSTTARQLQSYYKNLQQKQFKSPLQADLTVAALS